MKMICDICHRDIEEIGGEVYIDGKTKSGPWANMCTSCHRNFGVGLGLGKGQMYDLNKNKIESKSVMRRKKLQQRNKK